MNKQQGQAAELELTKDNLSEWKDILRSEMLRRYGIEEYDKTLSDEDWLTDFEEFTPRDAIDAEVENWEE